MAPLSAQSLAQSLAQTTPQMGAMTTLMRLMLLLQGRLAEVVQLAEVVLLANHGRCQEHSFGVS